MVRLPHCIQVTPLSPEISSQMLSPSSGLVRRAHAYCTPLMSPARSSRVRPSTTADLGLNGWDAFAGLTIPAQDTGTDILPHVLLRSECARYWLVEGSGSHRWRRRDRVAGGDRAGAAAG